MVRSRAKILEDDDADTASAKLRSSLQEHLPDETERAWIEPRLLQLLGLTERSAPDREDLFSAWRRFFERLAEEGPLVLVFEDIHWADEGLVAFVEYLLDWGRHHPIFVLTLSRPEVADRHPSFPGSTRSATTMPLEPLDDVAMDELLTGLVPELPEDVRARLREAADGIPLYAVETVRMLRDRGLVVDDGAAAEQVGDLARFEVPETLHALIASRLDALPDAERRLLQDGAVLGKTFTARGLAALSGLTEIEVEPLVADLVRKELLAVETDPFSPERGQLGFLQALVQRVTYETIARRDRPTRHLAAARFLADEAGLDPDEIAEVIAAHYLDAHEADPAATDADAVRAQARAWFTRAAERAASLAAALEAQRAFSRVAELSDDAVERGNALIRAGELALSAGRLDEAEALLRDAIATLGTESRSASAVAESALGEILFQTERLDDAIGLLERAVSAHEAERDEAAVATVSTQLARFCLFAGRHEEALVHVERGLELAERLGISRVVVQGLNNKGIALRGRPQESLGLMRQSLLLAEETGDLAGAIRACMNLSYLLSLAGREPEALVVSEHGLGLARTRGDRVWERSLAANVCWGNLNVGRWDDVERVAAELPDDGFVETDPVHAAVNTAVAEVALRRGERDRAIALAEPFSHWTTSARVQTEALGVGCRALVALAHDDFATAARECATGLRDERIGAVRAYAEDLVVLGGEAAWRARSADDLALILDLDDQASEGRRTPVGEAHSSLLRARLAVLQGDAEPDFAHAVARHRALDDPYWLASAQLDHAEWLLGRSRHDEAEPLLTAARETFEHLRARPRLERLEALEAAHGVPASTGS
jgi:tetratricopeptide (TPR) repeat protein